MTSRVSVVTRNIGGALKDSSSKLGFLVFSRSLFLFLWALAYQVLVSHVKDLGSGLQAHLLRTGGALLLTVILYFLLLPVFHRILFTAPYGKTDQMKTFLKAAREVLVQGVLATLVTFLSFVTLAYIWPPLERGLEVSSLDAYAMMVGGISLGALTFLLVGLYFRDDAVWIRGTVRLHPLQALYKSWQLTRLDTNAFFWALLWYPNRAAPTGLAVIGAPRTGKTLLIRLLIQSIAPLVFLRKDYRMIMLDVKKEMFEFLSGMGIDTSVRRGFVKTLDPDDKRAYVWDLSREFRSASAISELALLLVPPGKGDDKFWEKSARSIVVGVLRAWSLEGKAWQLRDLVAAMRSLDRVRAVLRTQKDTEFLIEKIISDAEELGKQTGAMDATLWSYISPFQDIATAWHNILNELSEEERSARLFTVSGWVKDPNGSIVLLGVGQRGSPKDLLVQVVVKRLGQLLRDHMNDDTGRRIWIILDEIRIAGRLDVETLLAVGGGRGASVVVGFQDKEGLNDEYRENISNEMLGLCQNKVFLGLSTKPTAEWASGEIGKREVERKGQRKEEPIISESELTEASRFPSPTPDKKVGITLVAKSRFLGMYEKRIRGKKLWRLLKAPGSEPGFLPRLAEDEIEPFPDWDKDELAHFAPSLVEETTRVLPFEPPKRTRPDGEKPSQPNEEKRSRRDILKSRVEARFRAEKPKRESQEETRDESEP